MLDTLELPVQPSERPKPVNWELVRALYLQDVPHSEISAQTGASVHAIRCRAYRNRWADYPSASNPPQPATPQDLVNEFQFNMSLSVVSATRYYANRDDLPVNGRDAKDWESARQMLVQTGRMLFGLDRDDRRSAWQGAQGNVIDVTSTTTAAIVRHESKSQESAESSK